MVSDDQLQLLGDLVAERYGPYSRLAWEGRRGAWARGVTMAAGGQTEDTAGARPVPDTHRRP